MAMSILVFLILLNLSSSHSYSDELCIGRSTTIPQPDVDLLEFPLNLEYLEAEFFLYGALGHGLDKVAPNLTGGGPPPMGAKRANLDPFTRDVVLQFALQEVGHLRAIKSTVKGFSRPLLDLSAKSFAKVVDKAFGVPLNPPFDPYCSSMNYLIASYLIPYVGLTGYVGANPKLMSAVSRRLVAGLLGVESGQDAVIRALLYEKAMEKVHPYGITVAEFTNRISSMRNKLGHSGLKDEGLIVPRVEGPEGKIRGNVLAGDQHSLSYARTPEEILRIVYGGGDERVPGGFFPKGADGRIARSHLHSA
ncbi:hypothetical protein ACOSP7_007117 [Xanthoceras sorbifolium]|uniref:Desiccation-related protein PCC13-62 n=1 Tax=Xanthoceras sorbifolium TaxID=99658 RepID=A0ABQ8GZ33_9ROSI|nr:hypothetical protein JRO89_XSUnG0222400 [Xanthoceras sorbifolium]